MGIASRASPASPAIGRERPASLQALPRRTYPLRMLGMGLAFLPLAAVMYENDGHWLGWAWAVFGGFLWPQLARWLAMRSADPFAAERRNFLIDSMLAGSWVPLIAFNVLPSVLLLTVVTADKVNSGIRGLWWRSLPGMLAAMIVSGMLTGFVTQPYTSMPVLLASLPIVVIHTLAVSISSYKLVRRVQRQNQQLEALNRVDALTGLLARGHWESQAGTLLQHHHGSGAPATLMLVDIDHFKLINDRHGHSIGDDVLRAIAKATLEALPPGSQAGRLGGDEFVVAMSVDIATALPVAERLRHATEALRLPHAPDLRCSISIGLAAARPGTADLRAWIEAADRALYRAKHAGRNRTEESAPAAGSV